MQFIRANYIPAVLQSLRVLRLLILKATILKHGGAYLA